MKIKIFKKKRLLFLCSFIALLVPLTLQTSIIEPQEAQALSNIVGSSNSFNKIAEYEFKDSATLAKDSVGSHDLINSGASYNSDLHGVSFWNDGYLYAPKIDGNKDFGDLIKGSYSVSMNLYAKTSKGGTHWLINNNLFDAGFGLSWVYYGFQMVGFENGNNVMNQATNPLFSSSWGWYRIHFIYNDTTKTFSVRSIKYNSDQKSVDSSYHYSIDEAISGSTLPFGGHESYSFTIGAQSQSGVYPANYVTNEDNESPTIKDIRIYSGVINDNEMAAIQEYDFTRKLDEEYNLSLDGSAYKDNMVLQREKPLIIEGQAVPNKTVTITFAGQSKSDVVDENGKFSITLDPLAASSTGRDFVVSTNYGSSIKYTGVVVGEVFIGMGQSNMAYPIFEFTYAEYLIKNNVNDKYPAYDVSKYNSQASIDSQLSAFTHYNQLHFYQQERRGGTVTPDSRIRYNTWICDSTYPTDVSFTSVAFAVALYEKLNVPVGIIMNAVGGSRIRQWVDDPGKEEFGDNNIFYKGMTEPLGSYNARGMLWYQGESDAYYMTDYVKAFKHMLPVWRSLYHDENLPIILYQLVQYKGDSASAPWGPVRMAHQQIADECDNAYMVCGIDTGDYCNIHPTEKLLLNRRAVGIALKEIYHQSYSGSGFYGESPMIIDASRNGNAVTLTFKNATSLHFASGTKIPLKVSNDKSNYEEITNYTLSGNKITFTTDKKYVSYAQDNYFIKNDQYMKGFVYNEYELPLAPFDNVEIHNSSYLVSVTNSNCSIDCDSVNEVPHGSDFVINITPNIGYSVSSVTVNDEPIEVINNKVTLSNITSNLNVVINCSINKYNISVSSIGASVDVDPSYQVDYNDSTTINISPNEGCTFSYIRINGNLYDYDESGSITLNNIKEDKNIEIVYITSTYHVSLSGDHFTIDGEKDRVVDYNGSVTYEVEIDEGYEFSSLYINEVDQSSLFINNSFTLTNIKENKDIVLTVTPIKYNVSITVIGASIDKDTSFNVNYNDDLTVNISPNEGYTLTSVTVNDEPVEVTNNKLIIENIKQNQNISIVCSINQYVVSISSIHGTITGDSERIINYNGSTIIEASPNEGYEFASLYINGVDQSSLYNNGHIELTNIVEDKEVTINYKKIKYNISVSSIGASVDVDPSYQVDYNDSTTINISPNEGCTFSYIRINGNLYDYDESGSITLNNIKEDKNIEIVYITSTYHVSLSGDHFTIDGEKDRVVDYNGSVTYEVEIDEGYEFSSLYINEVDQSSLFINNSFTLTNIKENKDIVLTVTPIKYNVSITVIGASIDKDTSFNVNYNDDLTVNISPNEGYTLTSVTVNDEPVEVTNNKLIIENIKQNQNISIVCSINQYVVSISSIHGTITGDSERIINYNGSTIIEASPNEGYEFASLYINGVDQSSLYNNGHIELTNIVEDKEVTINYKKIPSSGDADDKKGCAASVETSLITITVLGLSIIPLLIIKKRFE